MTAPLPDYGISFPDTSKDTLTILLAQDYAEKFIKQQVTDSNYNYHLSASQLWAIKADDSFYLLSAHPDVYDLLSESYNLSQYKGIIVHTTGWAAPLPDDGIVAEAPSKHESRRRIALAACVTSSSVGSALSFADDPEIILDPGSATGSLAEALLSFWEVNSVSGIISSNIESTLL